MPFLELSVEMLAACPLGSLAMLLLDASLKMSVKAGLGALGGPTRSNWRSREDSKNTIRGQVFRYNNSYHIIKNPGWETVLAVEHVFEKSACCCGAVHIL